MFFDFNKHELRKATAAARSKAAMSCYNDDVSFITVETEDISYSGNASVAQQEHHHHHHHQDLMNCSFSSRHDDDLEDSLFSTTTEHQDPPEEDEEEEEGRRHEWCQDLTEQFQRFYLMDPDSNASKFVRFDLDQNQYFQDNNNEHHHNNKMSCASQTNTKSKGRQHCEQRGHSCGWYTSTEIQKFRSHAMETARQLSGSTQTFLHLVQESCHQGSKTGGEALLEALYRTHPDLVGLEQFILYHNNKAVIAAAGAPQGSSSSSAYYGRFILDHSRFCLKQQEQQQETTGEDAAGQILAHTSLCVSQPRKRLAQQMAMAQSKALGSLSLSSSRR
ncbi:hypothetical protein ACA910_003674 [Epithemia clementina (nom. ined.)]